MLHNLPEIFCSTFSIYTKCKATFFYSNFNVFSFLCKLRLFLSTFDSREFVANLHVYKVQTGTKPISATLRTTNSKSAQTQRHHLHTKSITLGNPSCPPKWVLTDAIIPSALIIHLQNHLLCSTRMARRGFVIILYRNGSFIFRHQLSRAFPRRRIESKLLHNIIQGSAKKTSKPVKRGKIITKYDMS